MAERKTNAIRMLEAKRVAFTTHSYDTSDGQIDAVSVARKIGAEPSRLYKTLVARAAGGRSAGNVIVYCVPGSRELDETRAAAACGAASVSLVRTEELLALTGYVRGGCSPFGLKRAYPVFLDESARTLSSVIVSGGRVGIQIEVAPAVIVEIAGARYADLV
ncbi:aminoacyl-tRNA deacylase [Salinispira pacifica]